MKTEPIRRKIVETLDLLTDSRNWVNFRPRNRDVVVTSYFKVGTTWTQQIISQILRNGEEGYSLEKESPWLDCSFSPLEQMLDTLNKQDRRRVIKTHLPAYSMDIHPDTKYIYVARDGRDVAWSFYNYLSHFSEETLTRINETFKRKTDRDLELKVPGSPYEFYKKWFQSDGMNCGSFFDNVQTWWALKDFPNIFLLHFNDLKANLKKEVYRLSEFLETEVPVRSIKIREILEHCSFEYMKEHAEDFAPFGGRILDGGAKVFFYSGTNNRWKDSLSASEISEYESCTQERLGRGCAYWLENGKSSFN